ASLAGQQVATQLRADKPADDARGTPHAPRAPKDRAALEQVADIALEVLISSRNLTRPTISGGQTISIPDIQATAIRLKDAKILGQASSSDVTMRAASYTLRTTDVRDITEATALALMEDMLQDK